MMHSIRDVGVSPCLLCITWFGALGEEPLSNLLALTLKY